MALLSTGAAWPDATSAGAGPLPEGGQQRLLDDASDTATVVEVHAADALGVLHRITGALTATGLDVRTAHISTLGADVVDAFYVVGPGGGKLADPVRRAGLQSAVLAALG